jgi:hypothetical protein
MNGKGKKMVRGASPAREPAISWLVLVFQLPANPSNARVRVWRRLQAVGAVGLKNSAYVLPNTPQAREDFEWIAAEVAGLKGQASILVAETLEHASEREIVEAFRQARAMEYEGLLHEAEKLIREFKKGRIAPPRRLRVQRAVRGLRERFDEIEAADFFGAPRREAVNAALARIEKALASNVPAAREKPKEGEKRMNENFQSKTWVTRPRPGIDRMSSAWLIRNFIDAKSRFIFAEKPGDAANAIPFDMFGVRFGHQGCACTFETLATHFGIRNAAVERIGRIVHDLDLKDTRYQLPEETAVGRLVEGLRQVYADDSELLAHGMEMFEALYRSFSTNPQNAKLSAKRHAAKRGRSFLGLA